MPAGEGSASGQVQDGSCGSIDERGSQDAQIPSEGSAPVAPHNAPSLAQVTSDAIVIHEDELDAACHAASRSIDQLLWQGNADVAKAVALLGPGIVVLPMFGKVSGVSESRCLAYSSHPKRATRCGLMDRVDLESKFGRIEPGRLIQELAGGKEGLQAKIKTLSDESLQDEVAALQDWKSKANGRMKTLEKRAAYAFIGLRPGSTDRAAIKRAFKRRALELHPDKGGDAERFQLLQEMKGLLIEPTPMELEEKAKEEKEREKEQEDQQSKEKDAANDKDKDKEDENEDFEDTDFSDDSYDVDEEFRKMFPKDKKKKRRKPDNDDDLEDLGRDKNFNRDRHVAARLKLHRNLVEMWERSGKLVDEIKRMQYDAGGESLRTLRKFVDRFATIEVAKLRENDPKKAERIFRRFLEQGSEVICAAGAVDPVATVSTVAMQINYPLLQKAPSPELQERCSALVDAIQHLPDIFNKHVGPVEDLLINRKRAEKEAAAAETGPLHIILLMPDLAVTVQDGSDEIPGVRDAEIDMPPGSSVADLRAAGLQVFGRAVARLFCGGRFLGNDKLILSRIPELLAGAPVQCLASNKVLATQAKMTAQRPGTADQEATPAENPHALPEGAVEAAARAAAERRAKAKAAPSANQLPPETPAVSSCKAPADAEEKSAKPDGKEDGCPNTADTKESNTEREVRKEDQQAEEPDEDEEDDFFDDFFDATKKAADAKAAKEKAEADKREQEAQKKREEQEALEAQKRAEEKAQRKEAQEKGLSELEKRLQKQKQAAEAKKKLEAEKKKAAEARKKANIQQKENVEAEAKTATNLGGAKVDLLASVRKRAAEVQCRDLVKAKEDTADQALSRLRTAWDENWEHSCAGGRRADGSAIFCYPCNDWITVGEPYDHRAFELHCEKVGHYGWID